VQAEEEEQMADKAEKAASRRLALLAPTSTPPAKDLAAGSHSQFTGILTFGHHAGFLQ